MEKPPPKQKKIRGASREELLKLCKEELVDKVIQLEAYNFQLKNIISKNLSDGSESESGQNNEKHQKKFDFNKAYFRPVLLHIAYFGWDYQGFVVQEDTLQTIEHHLFKALTKACFIESRENAKYHRCGRTDKGVSAFGQVISLQVRSKHSPDKQNNPDYITTEMNYCKILNRLLPKEIRAVGWMPVPEEFSSRFDCKKRQYKYYFPQSSLDIEAMRESCSQLVGSHDFRNLCKMDVGNGVTEFRREILKADIIPVDPSDVDKPTSMYYLLIEGNAFLWHQIRCIQAVLLLVGAGLESKDIISRLLDYETYERKPQYNMAIDIPLNLFKCNYDIENTTQWRYDEENLAKLIVHYQEEWTIQNIKVTMLKDCLQNLEEIYSNMCKVADGAHSIEEGRIIAYHYCLTEGVKPKSHKPLLKRGTCSTLQERIEHYAKRRKQYGLEKSDAEK